MSQEKWVHVNQQNVEIQREETEIKTLKMPTDTGDIYLVCISNSGGTEYKLTYSPSIDIISKKIGESIVQIKEHISKIETEKFHNGEYKSGIIPVDRKKPEKNNLKETTPDYLPEDFMDEEII